MMSREHSEWTDRFSDYLSAELDSRMRERLETHVAECGACRRALEDVRDVVARAAGLSDRMPERDLWPGISAAISGPVRPRKSDVIALPTTAGSKRVGHARRTDGRIAFTAPQLAAAAVVLIAASAIATWWAGPGLGVRTTGLPVEGDSAWPVTFAAEQVPVPEGLSGELADLEEVLQSARSTLDPNTVRVLERNLAVIEQAITDSRQALALDPENEFLAHHLERVYERKLVYLRDAARVIELES